MRISYIELLSYYSKGLLAEMQAKLSLTGNDIMDIVVDHISDLQEQVDASENKLSLVEDFEGEVDNLKDEVYDLKGEIIDLKDEVSDLKHEQRGC